MLHHISHSQVGMFLRCPAQWMYRYIRGLKYPPPGNMFSGSCLHASLAENYQQKIETEKDLSVADVTDKFDEVFQNDAEVDWSNNDKFNLRDKGMGLVELHMINEAPAIFPVAVEEKITISVKGVSSPIVTIIDLITQKAQLYDYKMTGKTPKKNAADEYIASPDHYVQAWLYSHSFKATYGYDPLEAVIQYHVHLKASMKIINVHCVITPQKGQFAVDQIARVEQSIAACKDRGVFLPNRGQMMCSKKQCGYWKVCHEEFGPAEEVANMKEFQV